MFQDKKVLIVDDSKVERLLLSQILGKMGFRIFEAEDGAEGLKKAQEIKPDLILMDIVMPGGLNGFQATREIHKNEDLKHIPIIMCTSKDGDTDKQWGKRQGAADYLVKPVQEAEVVQTIKNILLSS